jgi:hypothetical protein
MRTSQPRRCNGAVALCHKADLRAAAGSMQPLQRLIQAGREDEIYALSLESTQFAFAIARK